MKFFRNTKINKRFELFQKFSQLTKLRGERESIKSTAFVLRSSDRKKTVSELWWRRKVEIRGNCSFNERRPFITELLVKAVSERNFPLCLPKIA